MWRVTDLSRNMKHSLFLSLIVLVGSGCYKTTSELAELQDASVGLDATSATDSGFVPDVTASLDAGADAGADTGVDASLPPSDDPCAHAGQSVTGGEPNAPISQQAAAAGRERDLVAFTSAATNLVSETLSSGVERLYLRDCETGHTELLVDAAIGNGIDVAADQSEVVFTSRDSSLVSDDTNDRYDVFSIDLDTRVIQRLSIETDGSQFVVDSQDPKITAGTLSGRAYLFRTSYGDLPSQLYVHHSSGNTQWIANVTDYSGFGIGADGRCAAYQTSAGVFVYDPHIYEAGDEQSLYTSASGGPEADLHGISITSDCRYIAFISDASNLVSGDTNGLSDAFVYDTESHTTLRLNVSPSRAEVSNGNVSSIDVQYFPIGYYYVAVYASTSTSLIAPPTSGAEHVYINYLYPESGGGGAEIVDRVVVDVPSVTWAACSGNAHEPRIDPSGERVTFRAMGSNFAGPVVATTSAFSTLLPWRI